MAAWRLVDVRKIPTDQRGQRTLLAGPRRGLEIGRRQDGVERIDRATRARVVRVLGDEVPLGDEAIARDELGGVRVSIAVTASLLPAESSASARRDEHPAVKATATTSTPS